MSVVTFHPERGASCGLEPEQSRPARQAWRFRSLAGGLLALALLAAHGWSLGDGLILDDHWHYRVLRDCSWSPSDLLAATTIDAENLLHTWWQRRPVRFEYSRPVSAAVMKLVYDTTSGSVVAQHAVNLLLHYVAAVLVGYLCFRLTGNRFWSLVGALLFTVYPLSVFAVGWLAAQNIVLQTVLALACLLAYVGASGLDLTGAKEARTTHPALRQAPPLGRGLFAVSLLLWSAALLTRENAIVLPVVLVAFDLAFGGWRQLWARRYTYALFAAVGIAFVAWRLGDSYEPMPDVYVRRPGDGGYLLWCAAKLLHYVSCSVWLAPMVIGPTGRYQPWSEAPLDCLLMLVIVACVATVYFLSARRSKGWWIWPLWIVLAVSPVVPVLATPHSGYLCGVGVAVGLVLGPARRAAGRADAARPDSDVVRSGVAEQGGLPPRWASLVAVVVLAAFLPFMKINRLLWKSMSYAEQFVTANIVRDPPSEEATEVFFINLPFAAAYSGLVVNHVATAHARRAPRSHVLVFAPHLLHMEDDCTLEQVDAHRFSLEPAGQPYFSGLLGRFLLDAFRGPERFEGGQHFGTDEFKVSILQSGPQGVGKLQFEFREPLASDRYCFYYTSPECGALKIHFKPPGWHPAEPVVLPPPPTTASAVRDAFAEMSVARSEAAAIVCAAARSNDAATRQLAETVLTKYVPILARALGTDVDDVLDPARPLGGQVDQMWSWWYNHVDGRTVGQFLSSRATMLELRHRRDEVKRARALARRFIQTDLYLTGPPFPGPRWDAASERRVAGARRQPPSSVGTAGGLRPSSSRTP